MEPNWTALVRCVSPWQKTVRYRMPSHAPLCAKLRIVLSSSGRKLLPCWKMLVDSRSSSCLCSSRTPSRHDLKHSANGLPPKKFIKILKLIKYYILGILVSLITDVHAIHLHKQLEKYIYYCCLAWYIWSALCGLLFFFENPSLLLMRVIPSGSDIFTVVLPWFLRLLGPFTRNPNHTKINRPVRSIHKS